MRVGGPAPSRPPASAGYTVQTIVALDEATEATHGVLPAAATSTTGSAGCCDEGDLGRVRNALVPRSTAASSRSSTPTTCSARTGWPTVSPCSTRRTERGERVDRPPRAQHRLRRRRGPCCINIDQDSPLFTPHFLYVRNYYDSLCLTPREAHLERPVRPPRHRRTGCPTRTGSSPIETMARGWEHVVVPRHHHLQAAPRLLAGGRERRPQRRSCASLPEMAIDRVRDLAVRGAQPDWLSSRRARSPWRRSSRRGGRGPDGRRRRCRPSCVRDDVARLRRDIGQAGLVPDPRDVVVEGLQPADVVIGRPAGAAG